MLSGSEVFSLNIDKEFLNNILHVSSAWLLLVAIVLLEPKHTESTDVCFLKYSVYKSNKATNNSLTK